MFKFDSFAKSLYLGESVIHALHCLSHNISLFISILWQLMETLKFFTKDFTCTSFFGTMASGY